MSNGEMLPVCCCHTDVIQVFIVTIAETMKTLQMAEVNTHHSAVPKKCNKEKC